MMEPTYGIRKAWRRHRERKNGRLTCKGVRSATTTRVFSALVPEVATAVPGREMCLYVPL